LAGEDKSRSSVRAAGRCLIFLAIMTSTLALAGCHKSAGQATAVAANALSDPSGYLDPPTVVGASRGGSGMVVLSGSAPPGAEVRLRAPEGGAFSATANDDGAWSIQLPPAPAPRMFAFEAELAGRVVHAEGAILTLPSPGPVAVMTRAGYGALVIGEGAAPLRIATIDYDGGGGAAVSGVTAARAPVRLVLDDQAVGAGEADEHGRFTVLDLNARKPFSAGSHALRIESQVGSKAAAVQGGMSVSPPALGAAAVFNAERDADAWRINWRIPGGGLQSTVVFDSPSTPTDAKS
jgi:hypothetical protein